MGNYYLKNQKLLTMSSTEEQAVQGVIDQIWEKYDVDKSGALDKEETKKFVIDTLGNLGSGDDFSDKLSMKSSRPSTKTDQAPLRRTKWLYSSSNSSETEHHKQLLEAERYRNHSDLPNFELCNDSASLMNCISNIYHRRIMFRRNII